MEGAVLASEVAKRLSESWVSYWAMRHLDDDGVAERARTIVGDDDELLDFTLRAFEEVSADDVMTLHAWAVLLTLVASAVLLMEPGLQTHDLRVFLIDGRDNLEEMVRRSGIADWCESFGFPLRDATYEQIVARESPMTTVPMQDDEAMRIVAELISVPDDANTADEQAAAEEAKATVLSELETALPAYDELLARIASAEDFDHDDLLTLQRTGLRLLIAARISGTVVLRTVAWSGDVDEGAVWAQRIQFALLLGIGLFLCADTSSPDERARLALLDSEDLGYVADLLPPA